MAELIAYVHVMDENGAPHVFAPGDEVPEWAQKKITNPAAWEQEAEAETPAAKTAKK